MRFLHVSTRTHIKYGGGERFLEQFLDGFCDHEHVFLGSDPVVSDLFEKRGYATFNSPAGFEPITQKKVLFIPISIVMGFVQFVRFFRLIRASDIILISASSIAEPIWLVPWIRLFMPKKRIIQSMHALCIHYYHSNPMTWFLRYMWKQIEVIFVSHAQFDSWKHKNLIGSKNHIIHNSVPFHAMIEKTRKKNHIKIGYIGRMYFEKGIDTMIQAISKLDPQTYTIEIVMAGTGEELKKLQDLQKSLPLHKNITYKWLGFVSETQAFYRDMDCIVFPSWIESFGLTTIEAWMQGVPVITSDIPAFQEVKQKVFKKERELMFACKNTESLITCLNFFIKNFSEYSSKEYKTSLHTFAAITFGEEKMIKRYKELLENPLL
jgi:glycosyltransferase involved in cell wall biosynthesis